MIMDIKPDEAIDTSSFTWAVLFGRFATNPRMSDLTGKDCREIEDFINNTAAEQAANIRTAAEALVAALTKEPDDYDGLVYYEYSKELAGLQAALSRGWLARKETDPALSNSQLASTQKALKCLYNAVQKSRSVNDPLGMATAMEEAGKWF